MRSLAAALCVMLLAAGTSGCRSCERSAPDQSAAVAAAKPVPLPPEAVGELVVADPSKAWSTLRQLTGSPLLALNPEIQLASWLELPTLAAAAFSMQAPIRGLIVLDKAVPVLVWAVPLRSGPELKALLVNGSQATFAAQQLTSGETLLSKKAAVAPNPPVLVLSGNRLLIGSSREALLKSSSYLAQPTFPVAEGAQSMLTLTLERALLEALVVAPLRQGWAASSRDLLELARQEAQLRGRPADFAEPAEALAIASRGVEVVIEFMQSVERARIRISPHPAGLELAAQLTLAANSPAQRWFAGLSSDRDRTWATLPGGTTLLWSENGAEREPAVLGREILDGARSLFGERIAAADLQKLHDTAVDLASGMAGSSHWGWRQAADGQAAILVTQLADPAAFERGIVRLLELAKLPQIKGPLGQILGDFRLVKRPAAAAATTAIAGFELLRSRPEAGAPRFTLHHAMRGSLGVVALGSASEAAVREVLAPSTTLGTQPDVEPLVPSNAAPSGALLLVRGPTGGAAMTLSAAGPRVGDVTLRLSDAMIQSVSTMIMLGQALPGAGTTLP